ncbi:MAG: Asp23/Gls24 family envelope stress response protein [Anaerolineales bacterium]
MSEAERPPGKTTIAPGVLVTIVKAAALQVDGVSRLAQTPSGVNTLFNRSLEKGVQVRVEENGRVHADIYLILNGEVNLRDTGMKVQKEAELAISKMVGLEVGSVNVHIENVDFHNHHTDEE